MSRMLRTFPWISSVVQRDFIKRRNQITCHLKRPSCWMKTNHRHQIERQLVRHTRGSHYTSMASMQPWPRKQKREEKKTIEESVALSERAVRIEKMKLGEEENVQNAVRLHLSTYCPAAALSHQSLCYEKHLCSDVPDKAAQGVKVITVFM